MASANTLCKKILNVNNTVVDGYDFSERLDGVKQLTIFARPNKWHDCDCPICHRRCPRDGKGSDTRSWRALDWGVRGKMILPPHGKEFFTRHGKEFFT